MAKTNWQSDESVIAYIKRAMAQPDWSEVVESVFMTCLTNGLEPDHVDDLFERAANE